ncbi:MAG: SMC-Scp complex subunit ScpB [Gemmatimonadetes bacterium]|nr:SMC-Scp complex subunit ScpB [Gemmatimonadota bacterium]
MALALKAIVEALLFASDEPLPLHRLAAVLEESSPDELLSAIRELNAGYAAAGAALEAREIGGGWQLLTRPELDPWIVRLAARPPRARLSQPALETLAIVAYKQPVNRIELEEIRGVNVEGVLRTLIERDLVTVVGRDEGLGRPLLYGTTPAFLAYFGLTGINDLPRLDELEVFLAERDTGTAAPPALAVPGAARDAGGPPDEFLHQEGPRPHEDPLQEASGRGDG